MFAAGAMVCVAGPAWAGDDSLPKAATFIRETGQRLGALTQGQPSAAEKRRRLESFLDEVVDIDGVARFCLGRFWAAATPPQRQDYLAVFRQVLVTAVAVRVGDYPAGQFRVTINPPVRMGTDIQVPTEVIRGDATPPARITWTLSEETGKLRIVDILAEGVSLRITQRSDYASFLRQNNNDIAALLRALHDQVAAG
ncbi:MAG: ABC transporter substrate-binding protein [Acetobacteraceae bacterium]|nr:ABC transporter substrate-binding protein [Pseudomonadota bacterium]